MNRVLKGFVLAFTLILILGVNLLCKREEQSRQVPTVGSSIEEIEQLGGWWVTVPAAENRFLEADINGTSFEDFPDEIFLIMPEKTDEKNVVFYVRDITDAYALRVSMDFSKGSVQLGSKTISLVKSRLPFIYMKMDSNEYNTMLYDRFREHEDVVSGTVIVEDSFESKMTLTPHGNATWMGPQRKKSFNLTLEKKYHLWEMSKNKKWNMIANYLDRTILANTVFYQMAEDFGLPYTCERENATVYVNGKYEGVYLITTKIKVAKNLVNLSEGDYLLNLGASELLEPDELNYFSIDSEFITGDQPRNRQVLVKYPEENPNISFISDYVQRAFDALADEDSDEYLNYFDVDNLARFYLFEEFIQNSDGCSNSIMFYYDHSRNKLIFGPVWDHDYVLNTDPNNPHAMYNRSWYRMFFLHDSFIEKVYDVYNSGIKDSVITSLSNYREYADFMSVDGEMNNRLNKPDMRTFIDDYVELTYEEECDETITYYEKRIEEFFDILDNRKLKYGAN